MKKIIAILFLLSSTPSLAQSNDLPICSGEGVRTITITDPVQRVTSIQSTINNYKNYLRGNRYELCFVYSNGLDQSQRWTKVSTSPLQAPSAADKPVVISGLDLRGYNQTVPLFVSDGTEVILHNDKFTCADGSKPSSIGIKLLGDAHQVLGSEIKNCGTGIQVGDPSTGSGQAGVAGNNMHIGPANKIHDNNIGVSIANGGGNLINQNSVYKNDANNNGRYEQTEGIQLLPNANNNLVPPPVLNIQGALAQTNDPILSYPAGITSLPADNQPPVQATFQLQPPYSAGDIEVDLITGDQYGDIRLDTHLIDRIFQGEHFYTDVNCASNATSYSCQIPMTQGKKDQKAVLLFHDPTFGTTTYSVRVILNGPGTIPLGGGGPGPVDVGSELTGGGASPPATIKDDDSSSKNSMSGAALASGSGKPACSLLKSSRESSSAVDFIIILALIFVMYIIRRQIFVSVEKVNVLPSKRGAVLKRRHV